MIAMADMPSGLRALDALSKEAPVSVLNAGTVQGGLFLLLFGGDVESVGRSHERACHIASGAVVDEVFLAHAEERLLPALRDARRAWPCAGDTLGVLQVASPPTLLRAVDAALKGANVELVELRIADGLAGRGVASLWGETHDVEAAAELGRAAFARGLGEGARVEVIANADDEVQRVLAQGTRFFGEWRG